MHRENKNDLKPFKIIFMRRIESLSEELTNVGDWAEVKVKINDRVENGIIARVSCEYLCFASNSNMLNGSRRFSDGWNEIIASYRFGWTIRLHDCSTLLLNDILTRGAFDCGASIKLIGVYKRDGSLLCVNATTQEEYECSGQNETSFMNSKYEAVSVYRGIHGYHHHHGGYQNAPKKSTRGHKIGVELEVEFNNSTLKNDWSENFSSNWFYCERDGSLNDNGTEIITVPMNPKDIKCRDTWDGLISYLSSKAKSWDSPRCGLHVHIGREILGNNPEQQSETIGKLLYLYHHFVNGTTMNTRIFGRDRAYNAKDGKTREGDAVATLGCGVLKLKEIKDTLKKGMIDKSSSDRYFDINLMNSNTIEFRKGRGSIKASRIITVIEYCEMMCKYAKSVKWEDISKDAFVSYVKSNISKDSPLYDYFEEGESCDISL